MEEFTLKTIYADNRLLIRYALDLTFYPEDITNEALNYVVDLYHEFCPREKLKVYRVAESPLWRCYDELSWDTKNMNLSRPLDRLRYRVDNGWRVDFRIWDGDSEDGWSFHCYRIPHKGNEPPVAFYRILMPLTKESELLSEIISKRIAQEIQPLSAHGGYTFLYDTTRIHTAFCTIYRLARRYRGIDIEYLNGTLPLMRYGIKGINWLTYIGPRFLEKIDFKVDLSLAGVRCFPIFDGMLFVIGDRPVVGDCNRPSLELSPYYCLAHLLQPVWIDSLPEFPGRFGELECTNLWYRRFIEPKLWSGGTAGKL